LEPVVRLLQGVDRAVAHGGAEADGHRVAVPDRLLKRCVCVAVDTVRHRDHVVESGKKGVPVTVAEVLGDVGEQPGL